MKPYTRAWLAAIALCILLSAYPFALYAVLN